MTDERYPDVEGLLERLDGLAAELEHDDNISWLAVDASIRALQSLQSEAAALRVERDELKADYVKTHNANRHYCLGGIGVGNEMEACLFVLDSQHISHSKAKRYAQWIVGALNRASAPGATGVSDKDRSRDAK